MRVIEPRFQSTGQHRGKKLWFLAIVLMTAGFLLLYRPSINTKTNLPAPDTKTQSQTKGSTDPMGELKTFTAEEYKNLYRSIAYPNVQEIITPPVITGNIAADEHLRSIAEQRGYRLTSAPVEPIKKITGSGLTDDDLLQEKAAVAWKELKEAAGKESVPLTIVSAYRSIDFQRNLFLGRLRLSGINNAMVAQRKADDQVITVLEAAALPGYSRHHTGYTMDLACGSIGLYGFKKTGCYNWLSRDNYKNAKLHGWIPSYPEGALEQGPEPEPWEFVWVGKQALTWPKN